jgi:hypothetical protein
VFLSLGQGLSKILSRLSGFRKPSHRFPSLSFVNHRRIYGLSARERDDFVSNFLKDFNNFNVSQQDFAMVVSGNLPLASSKKRNWIPADAAHDAITVLGVSS